MKFILIKSQFRSKKKKHKNSSFHFFMEIITSISNSAAKPQYHNTECDSQIRLCMP